MDKTKAKQCLFLVLAVALLCHGPLAAAQHGNNPPFSTFSVDQLFFGDQCSVVPSPSLLKHDPAHCGQQNSTLGARDAAYWHVVAYNSAFVYS
eukprot:CAMPEP_0177648102 /NCGR_PEP_ID=MMETSP0447-20121125/10652_1 /TAXON_ID=0 /ORGANISM="Stygamoeba regulata, Strain BSH-02190019" /LENGTH=92 /DNA_ID=CAMNT_0019150727 /DNA_START=175 /DNA_END=449 /DNA_ORIENTATION=-